jgi:polar amino acid transport system substrate-binding protein
MRKTSLYIIITLIIITTAAVWRSAKKAYPASSVETIIIGTNAEFQPFSFKKDDIITGFDIEVIEEIFKRLDKKIIFKDMPFDALIPEIQLGNIHVIAGGITPTKERAQKTLFTEPHITGDSLAIISLKSGPHINSIHDLIDKNVAVNEGYTADFYMTDQQGINLIRLSSSSVSEGILALQSNRADAFVTALRPMEPYFTLFGKENLTIIPIEGTEESSAFAISKHYPELRDLIQITLDRMQADGTLDALKKKWNLE